MSTCISKRGEFGSHEFVRSGDTVICEDCGYLAQVAPESRSTPGPSTGTPEPSQAASEAHSSEVARLREALEQVRALHRPFRIYDECDCPDDVKDDDRHHDVDEVGRTCNLMYVTCWDCCTGGSGYQSEECVDHHQHSRDENGRCPTARILASVDAPAPDEADEPWNDPRHVDALLRIADDLRVDAPTVPAEGGEAGRGFRQAVAEVLPMLVRVNGRCQACSEPVSEDAWPSHAADAIAELLPLAAVSPAPAPDESR